MTFISSAITEVKELIYGRPEPTFWEQVLSTIYGRPEPTFWEQIFSSIYGPPEPTFWEQVAATITNNPVTTVSYVLGAMAYLYPATFWIPGFLAAGFGAAGPIANGLAPALQSLFGTPAGFRTAQSATLGGWGGQVLNGVVRGAVLAGTVLRWLVRGRARDGAQEMWKVSAVMKLYGLDPGACEMP